MNKMCILTLLGVFLLACNNEDSQQEIPNCIQEKIEDIKGEDVWNPPAKIFSYQYEGKTVYYITARCCDIMSQLYDENCNYICAPDGGIAGNGDGKCIDFLSDRTNEKLIWEDKRK